MMRLLLQTSGRFVDDRKATKVVQLYLFADEAGCFTFSREPNVSRYFILCTVTANDLNAGAGLSRLRHELVWEGAEVGDFFHATVDKQHVRDRVFTELLKHDFQVQATICEKAKAQPQVRKTKSRFYQYPWYYHFKHGIARHIPADSELLVTAASIGVKKEREVFTGCLSDVMQQTVKSAKWAVDFRPSMADPYLQVADYCAWAIQRRWEKNDTRSYDLIQDRITYQYDLWAHGNTLYY